VGAWAGITVTPWPRGTLSRGDPAQLGRLL